MRKHWTSLISQQFGKFADVNFPKPLQWLINTSYVKLLNLDMSEFNVPGTYKSLNSLFTRRLKKMRHFDESYNTLCSPCDSYVTECGELDSYHLLQIKGMGYRIEALLGEKIESENKILLFDGSYINFYLSPKDYHRFHSPCKLRLLKAVHIPGKLYPVNIPSLKSRLNLFVENERVVLEAMTQEGKMLFLVFVGALNVGRIRLNHAPSLRTNASSLEPTEIELNNTMVEKGEELGCFEMGSTVVMVCEKDSVVLCVKNNQNVRFGESIGTFK